MIIGINNIIEFVRYNESPLWYIRRAEKSDPIFTSGDNDNLTLEESIARLQKCLEMLSTGSYFIETWTANQKKMRNKDSFMINSAGNDAGQSNNINVIGGISGVQDLIAKALEDYKKEQELERLKSKINTLELDNRNLKEEVDNVGTRIYKRIEPFLGAIMGENNIPNNEISGGNNITAEDAQKRLEKAFELWAQKEPNTLLIVEKIANMAVNDPETYKMARSILLK